MNFYLKSLCRPRAGMAKILLVMKLIVILLTTAILQVSASSFGQSVTLKQNNAKLTSVLDQIRKQTGYDFFYSQAMMENAKPISVNLNKVDIKEALEICFRNQPLSYTIENNIVTIKEKEKSFIENVIARFQAIDVRGKVVDSLGNGLAGATVSVKGGKGSTSTDAGGNFRLKNIDEDGILIISYLGYISKQLPVNKEFNYIVLQISESKLDEVKIIAYGTTTQRLSTGSSASLNARDIDMQPVNNPLLALSGRMAGVEINQSNGIAGSQIKINIRGINSLRQGMDPLFIVNGIPYNSNLFNTPFYGGLNSVSGGGGGNQNFGLNPLSLINPSDIESIDVLKDADATAIYGSRAANGVVLITTKKGKAGATKIDMSLQSGVGEVTRTANFMNTQQYVDMRKKAFENDNIDLSQPPYNEDLYKKYLYPDLAYYDQNRYTDWQNLMIGGTSQYTNFRTSISGGNEYNQMLLGVNYSRETTVFPGDWNDNKISLHFNLNNSSTNKKFKVSTSGTFLIDNNQLPTIDFTRFIALAPNAPMLTLPDGTLNWNDYDANPFKDKFSRYKAKASNLLLNSELSYAILPSLIIKSNFGLNGIFLNEARIAPSTTNNPSSGIKTGSTSFNNNDLKSLIIEPQITYEKNIGKSKFSGLLGGTYQHRSIIGQVINGDGYTDDTLLESLAAAAVVSKGQSVYEQYKYSSVFARINWNYSDTYLLNLTARRDGSSRFGPDNRYGNFGSIGAAWIFSNLELFKKWTNILSFGKLRTSYGTIGNEPSTNYTFLERYEINTSNSYGGGAGAFPINIPAPDFRWEVNKKFEAGLELSFVQDRINIITSYFKNRSSNQLITRPLPPSVGFQSVVINLPATVQNTGWEFSLSSSNVINEHFTWKTNFNITASRNKLIAFPNLEISGFGNLFKIGEPINFKRVYRLAGVDTQTGRYQFYNPDGSLTSEPILMDGSVNVNPEFYGGLQNSFSFKNFTFDVHFQFVRQKGLNYLYSNANPPGWFSPSTGLGNQPLELAQLIANQDDQRFQKYSQDFLSLLSYSNAQLSDAVYSDASFVRLKNITFAYNFPEKVVRRCKLSSFTLFASAQNLITLTKYKGTDPETQDITALPPLRVITCGVKVGL